MATVTIVNNIFDSYGTVIKGTHTGSVTNNLSGTNVGFVNRAAYNYQLESGSLAIDQGISPGSGSGFSMTPAQEYVHACNVRSRPVVGALDLGAYEFSDGGNNPPVMESVGDQMIPAGQPIQLRIQASD